jgi:hypothetical protein
LFPWLRSVAVHERDLRDFRTLAGQTPKVNLLKTDPTYLETIARDRLDLMEEGKTIFRLEPKPTAHRDPTDR